jgi:hypothetical protein
MGKLRGKWEIFDSNRTLITSGGRGSTLLPADPLFCHITTILPSVVGRSTVKRKVAGSNLVYGDTSVSTPLAVVGLWVPG